MEAAITLIMAAGRAVIGPPSCWSTSGLIGQSRPQAA
jgi:hypothetical protein